MEEEYTAYTRLETRPTGASAEQLLEEVVTHLDYSDVQSESTNPEEVVVFFKGVDAMYKGIVAPTGGSQETGFLIKVEVTANKNFSTDTAQKYFKQLENAVRETFTVIREVR